MNSTYEMKYPGNFFNEVRGEFSAGPRLFVVLAASAAHFQVCIREIQHFLPGKWKRTGHDRWEYENLFKFIYSHGDPDQLRGLRAWTLIQYSLPSNVDSRCIEEIEALAEMEQRFMEGSKVSHND